MAPHVTYGTLAILLILVSLVAGSARLKVQDDLYRPEYHFSVPANWLNDPNGLVYYDGEYHLYYQYHPYGTVPNDLKHWAHAVSPDLLSWTHLPIALYPDELGGIWSGSSVVDHNNSSGLQTDPNHPPIVALFTSAGASQQQSMAYSNDKGRTFTKFEGNPVIPNPVGGFRDFRDPKVFEYEGTWSLVLTAGDRVQFYKSTDLKDWTLTGEFGAEPSQGHHGGAWECPDIFQIEFEGQTVWVLLVSVGGGGPNGGSTTQYFIGQFNGETFTSSQMNPLWLDWGTDNYAGITFFNEPQGRTILIGWMSNLDYACCDLPTATEGWLGQMTLPRVLSLERVNGVIRIRGSFPEELQGLELADQKYELSSPVELQPDSIFVISEEFPWTNPLMKIDLDFDMSELGPESSISICLYNGLGQEVCTGFDNFREDNLFLDRGRSGNTGFSDRFSLRPTGIREVTGSGIQFQIYLDISAVEVRIDDGISTLLSLFYPDEPFTSLEVRHHANGVDGSRLRLETATVQGLRAAAK